MGGVTHKWSLYLRSLHRVHYLCAMLDLTHKAANDGWISWVIFCVSPWSKLLHSYWIQSTVLQTRVLNTSSPEWLTKAAFQNKHFHRGLGFCWWNMNTLVFTQRSNDSFTTKAFFYSLIPSTKCPSLSRVHWEVHLWCHVTCIGRRTHGPYPCV